MIHRRLAARVLAAALVAAAASGLLAGCGTNPFEPPQAGGDDRVEVWAPAEVPEGYAICSIERRSGEAAAEDPARPHLEVYADVGLADPYTGPLVWVVAIEVGDGLEELLDESTPDTTPAGRAVLVGPASEFQLARLPGEAGVVVTWRIGDGVAVQLAGRRVGRDELLAIADAVELDALVATLPLGALPEGFGSLGDVYELERRTDFLFGLDYRPEEIDGRVDDQLTVLGSTGDLAAMEAFRFRAATSERIEVQGHPGVAADVGEAGRGPFVVTWLAEDDLVLRLFSFDLGTDRLRAIAETVEPLGETEVEKLATGVPNPPCS